MIEQRPDWVLSRQRAWGVPICVFADAEGNVLKDETVNGHAQPSKEGADAWFAEGLKETFPRKRLTTVTKWRMVTDDLGDGRRWLDPRICTSSVDC